MKSIETFWKRRFIKFTGDRGFDFQSHHTKYVKNGTGSSLALHSVKGSTKRSNKSRLKSVSRYLVGHTKAV